MMIRLRSAVASVPPAGRRRSRLLPSLALGLIATACGEAPVEQAPVARPVKILTVGSTGGGVTIEYPGTISAAQHADMAFEVPGRITEFDVNEGQKVSKGTVLARLDARDFEAARDRQAATLKAAEAQYERTQALYETDAASLQDLEVARRNADMAEANLRTARKALEDTVLRAPFAGRVAKKLVEDFQNVQAKQPVLMLQDTSSLEIVINVPEGDSVRATAGLSPEEQTEQNQPVVIVSSLPDRRFPARLKEFATIADPVTRTFEATLAFSPPDDAVVQPGMTARIVVTPPAAKLGGTAGIAIPSSAVVSDDQGAAFVWVVDPQTMQVSRRPVKLGELSGSRVGIRSGLGDGDWIALSGVHQLQAGMAVRRLAD